MRRPLAFVLTLLSLAHGPTALSGQSSPPAAVPPTPAQLRADLDQLRNHILLVEKSWTDSTRALGLARLDSLRRATDTISMAAFALGVSRVVATADNAHSGVPSVLRADRFDRVGVRLVPFGTDFHVLRAEESLVELLGARLVSIDGHALAALRSAARALSPGTPARRDRFAPDLLESPEQLHALGLARTAGVATYAFELTDGRRVERRLVAAAPSRTRLRGGTSRWLLAGTARDDSSGWRALRSPAALPWSLQTPERSFRIRELPEFAAVMLDIRRNSDSGGDLAAFMDSARATIARTSPRNLVVDLRLNGGGNLQLTRDFMRALPTLVPGQVFVLTSPWTFSAAISSTGYLKQAAPSRVTIVGEDVGDRLVFWAEGGPATLENTGLLIGTSRERHDYMNGCRAFTDCHGPVIRAPISVPTLAPEVQAPWTIDDYRAGRDPALQAIAERLRR